MVLADFHAHPSARAAGLSLAEVASAWDNTTTPLVVPMPVAWMYLPEEPRAYYLLRDRNEAVQLGGLVFVAGLLTVAAVEDMLGEAHESADDTWSSTAAMVGGFVLFTLVSAGMGDG